MNQIVAINFIIATIIVVISGYVLLRRSLITRIILIAAPAFSLFGYLAYWLGQTDAGGTAFAGLLALYVVLVAGAAFLASRLFTEPVRKLIADIRSGKKIETHETSPITDGQSLKGHGAEFAELQGLLAQISHRNSQLVELANRVADGDLSINIGDYDASDPVEIAFNKMIRHWKKMVAQVQAGVNALKSSEGGLSQVTVATDDATQQILKGVDEMTLSAVIQTDAVNRTDITLKQFSESISNIAAGAQEQAREVHRTTAAVEKMSEIIEQVDRSAETASEVGMQVNQAAQTGATSVREVLKSMERVGVSVYQAAERVQEMGQRSEKIGNIVEAIEDISAKTEMLALNAAIEAARAGEHGKPFAVVADAVRQLADRASIEAQEITGIISQVQQNITEIIKAMELSADEVRLGNDLAATAREKLDDILQAIASSDTQIKEIAAAVHEMADSKRDMVEAVNTVSAVVEENTAMTEQMAASSREVQENIITVTQVSHENTAIVKGIDTSAGLMKEQVDKVMVASGGLKGLTTGLENAIGRFNLLDAHKNGDTLKIAYLPIADHLALPITYLRQLETADKSHFQGVRCASWPELMEQVKGDADGALIMAPLATLLSQDIPLQIILPAHRNGSGLVLDTALGGLEDLKSKTIAIPHLYSTHNILLYKALSNSGLHYNDVNVIPAPPPLMPYLLQRGKLSGFISAEPSLEVALSIGAGRIEFLSKDIEYGHICCVLAMKEDSLKRNEETVVQLLADFMQSGLWIQDNVRAAAEAVSPFFGIPPAVTERVLTTPVDRITYDDFELRKSEFEDLLSVMGRMDLLNEPVDVDRLVNEQYYQQAIAQNPQLKQTRK